MMTFIKKLRNFWLLVHYWELIDVAKKLENDPDSLFSSQLRSELTFEEEAGLQTLVGISQYLEEPPKENKKAFKKLIALSNRVQENFNY